MLPSTRRGPNELPLTTHWVCPSSSTLSLCAAKIMSFRILPLVRSWAATSQYCHVSNLPKTIDDVFRLVQKRKSRPGQRQKKWGKMLKRNHLTADGCQAQLLLRLCAQCWDSKWCCVPTMKQHEAAISYLFYMFPKSLRDRNPVPSFGRGPVAQGSSYERDRQNRSCRNLFNQC